MRTLVTGASGFAGSLLIPQLICDGHVVRAVGRDPARVRAALARAFSAADRAELSGADLRELEVRTCDLVTGDGLKGALDGIEVAYYLIHSMEQGPVGSLPFYERDRMAAQAFASEAVRAGVRRIVYLGGLLPSGPRSQHLDSRAAVEHILLSAIPDSVGLRASIVIGAHSRSFRLLVHLIERLPLIALPNWQSSRTQPIDARDVTEMLLACASADNVGGVSLDIGGPDLISYGKMLSEIAELMLLRRPAVSFGASLTPIVGRIVAAIADEDPELVLPLMEGLQGDLLPANDRAAERLGVYLHSFPSAVEHALREWEEHEPLVAR